MILISFVIPLCIIGPQIFLLGMRIIIQFNDNYWLSLSPMGTTAVATTA
jgi:hypothetical protein